MSTPTDEEGSPSDSQEVLSWGERGFRALIEHSSDVIILANAEGIVTYVSPSLTSVLGYTSEEFIGLSSLTLIHPDDLSALQKISYEIRRSPGKSLSSEYRLRCKDGSWRWFEGTGTNLLHNPDVEAIVGNFRDITAR
ncbi:MAG: PAS domain S-box protein, partial [Ktedonobacteraceae bacterium]|nr:PAS domain S-box protein [Ktedonobacteraceae bacterium]